MSSSSTSTPRARGRTWRPRWRPTSATGRSSSAPMPARRSTRGEPTSSRSSCPTCPTCSARGPSRSTRCSSTSTPPDAHGFCSLGVSVEAMHAAVGCREDRHRAVQPLDAAHARRVVHPRQPDRPCGRGRPAAVRVPASGARRRRAPDRRVHRGPRPRRGDAPARHRRHPGRDGRAAHRQEGPRDPHRDVHGRRRRPGRGRRRHRGRKVRNRGKIVVGLHDGHVQAVPVRP